MTNPSASTLLGKFVWYDQMSNDLPGVEKFYSKVVGWTLAPNTMNDQRYTLLQAGSAMIGGLMPIPEHAKGVQPAWMGYIAVDDVKAYADKVKAAGGAIHRPPTEIPNVGTFAVAGDPSGAGFMLFKGNSDQAPTQDPSQPGHIGWHEVHGGDPESAFAFYSDLFGWTKGEAMDMGAMGKYQIFATKGEQRGGMMKKTAQEPAPHWALLHQRRRHRRGLGAGRVRRRQGRERTHGGSKRQLDHQWPRSAIQGNAGRARHHASGQRRHQPRCATASRVLWGAWVCAGTVWPNPLRISGTRKSVVAVTGRRRVLLNMSAMRRKRPNSAAPRHVRFVPSADVKVQPFRGFADRQ